jgi:hypothetical protein
MRDSRKRKIDSFSAILDHSRVIPRVFLSNHIRDTPAVGNGFPVKRKQQGVEFCIKLYIHFSMTVRADGPLVIEALRKINRVTDTYRSGCHLVGPNLKIG